MNGVPLFRVRSVYGAAALRGLSPRARGPSCVDWNGNRYCYYAALLPSDPNASSALPVSPVAAQDATFLESRRLGRSDRRETEQENRDANGGVLTCEYCAIGLRPEAGSDNSLEHDHLEPVSTGGKTTKENDRI